MTTVVADARIGFMGSDSKISTAGVWYPARKVFAERGELLGLAGEVDECLKWMDWYLAGKPGKPPKLRKDSTELLILKKGGLYHTTGNSETKIDRGYHAIGSGAMAALAAIDQGATALGALRCACRIDPESGGRLVVLRLKQSKPKKGTAA